MEEFCRIFLFTVFLISCFHCIDADDCMTGGGIKQAFVVRGTCFWVYNSGNFSDWDSAKDACSSSQGSLAILDSEAKNKDVANLLTRPAFFGYHKLADGTWDWTNGTSTYNNTYTDTGGAHMALVDKTAVWETTHIDAKKYIYDILCSLDRDPYLRCPDVSVAYSSQDNNMPLYSGESVTFTCEAGYHVTVGITVQTLSCLSSNRWSFPARDCKPIECDLIDPPAYTTRSSERHFVGDKVTYTCTNDTWFSAGVSSKVFRCTGTGQWSPTLQPCKAVRCEPPPALYMGRLDTTVTLYQHTITYTCITGYKFADDAESKTITCQGTGPSWAPNSEIESLNCTAIACPNPPQTGERVEERSEQKFDVGYYQVWYCEEGTIHDTNEYATAAQCLQSADVLFDNDWSRTIPTCNPVFCDALNIEDSSTGSIQVLYYADIPVTYNCSDEGFMFPGGENELTISCGTDKQWDYEIPLSGCDESGCENGWIKYNEACYFFSNGDALGLRYEYAEESCNYKRANLAMITSEQEAAWIATQTYDVYQADFWIGYHEDSSANWVWKGDKPNNFTNFAEGYPEYYKCARTSVKGFWKDRNCDELLPYVCKKIAICGPSPVIAHGTAASLPEFPVDFGATVTYSCDEGYVFKGIGTTQTIACEEGGFWSKISNCVPTVCPPLNRLDREVKNAWFDTAANTYGTVVTYTCQDGKLFPDGSRVKKIECMSSGEWSGGKVEHCKNFKCPKPASPATTPLYGYDELGDMDYYTCDPGYSFVDGEIEKLFWCDRDGTWHPKGQICIRRACPIYTVPFATVTPESGVYEEEIVAECNYGFEFPDKSTRKTLTCTAEGVWSTELPPCVATKCEGPKPPDVGGAYRDTDVIKSGTLVNYTCLHDLVFINGDKIRQAVCDIDTLLWKNVPTDCVEEAVEIKSGHVYKPTEAKAGPAYASIGLALIGTLIVLIIVSDLATISRFISCDMEIDPTASMFQWNSSNPDDVTQLTDVESQNAKNVKTKINAKKDANQPETTEQNKRSNDSESEYETDDEDEEIPTYAL